MLNKVVLEPTTKKLAPRYGLRFRRLITHCIRKMGGGNHPRRSSRSSGSDRVRRGGGGILCCDDGRDESSGTADHRPRSDKRFEIAHSEKASL